MFELVKNWYKLNFSDPQAIALCASLFLAFIVLYIGGELIAPILIALVIAFLLDWPVSFLTQHGFARVLSTTIVVSLFLSLAILTCVGLLPSVWKQGLSFMSDFPNMMQSVNDYIHYLNQQYPNLNIQRQLVAVHTSIDDFFTNHSLIELGKSIFSLSTSLLIVVIYMILVPLLVFFFLKDKYRLKRTVVRFLPRNQGLIREVWYEMDVQIFNYIRGKIIEVVIVGSVSYLLFYSFDLRYSSLLAVLTGLSVLIPYIGAMLVTIPIVLVSFFQFNFSSEFSSIVIGYLILQALDGNVLVPLLFSEAVNLHPVSIIAAVLIFGGLWGILGLFFAIPLASLIKTIIQCWPTNELYLSEQTAD